MAAGGAPDCGLLARDVRSEGTLAATNGRWEGGWFEGELEDKTLDGDEELCCCCCCGSSETFLTGDASGIVAGVAKIADTETGAGAGAGGGRKPPNLNPNLETGAVDAGMGGDADGNEYDC